MFGVYDIETIEQRSYDDDCNIEATALRPLSIGAGNNIDNCSFYSVVESSEVGERQKMVNKFVDYLMALHAKMVKKIPQPIKQAKYELEDALEEIKSEFERKKQAENENKQFSTNVDITVARRRKLTKHLNTINKYFTLTVWGYNSGWLTFNPPPAFLPIFFTLCLFCQKFQIDE